MTAALIKAQRCVPDRTPVSKWDALRELATARKAYGLTDRTLSVLQALLSFHKSDTIDRTERPPIVFASNRAICERLNGMPCSTMRRHLARLVEEGLLIRRDSPNGKRYCRRYGSEAEAFGFDLTPLAARLDEFRTKAEDARAERDRVHQLRQTLSLMLRDLAELAAFSDFSRTNIAIPTSVHDLSQEIRSSLRRKLTSDTLETHAEALGAVLADLRSQLELPDTENSSTSDAKNEQHLQSSDKDSLDMKGAVNTLVPQPSRLSLDLVLSTCKEIGSYSVDPIQNWHQLESSADMLAPMIGVSRQQWSETVSVMGRSVAAVVLAAMLEQLEVIRSPAAYLRTLTRKAADGKFSPLPMLNALTNRKSTRVHSCEPRRLVG